MQGYGQYGGGGFQQPQQTGFGMGMGMGMLPQPTGFPQQPQPQQLQQQQPMQTGFQPQQQRPSQPSFLSQAPPSSFRPQPTGMSGMSMSGMSGLTPQMTGYPGGGASGLMPQQTGYPGGGGLISQPTGFGGAGLMPQATGMGMLRAQPTGFHDPRLQTMMQSFMPSNISQPFAPSGAPQFGQAPNQQPLAQTFQSLLNNPSVKTPKVPWVLTKQEKKDYDQIFRAWDTKGDGFIPGEMAREVFGQSGLGQDDLMKIWNLSDVDNRGKLNLPEFHVAMGLIYRALNGNEIPDVLPEELVPASMRDIDTTVNFMRDLLKHESSTRSSTASSPAFGMSGAASKDATMYKHDDDRPTTYKPSSRHLDRKSVRYAGEDSGAEITDLRRQLQSSSARLDQSNDDYQRKSAEDEELEAAVDDIKYRVRRIQEDIDYVSKGRKTAEKDEERRKLERELLYLMHEKLPEIERRQQQREEEKRRDERAGTRARDRRNETHGRYGRDDRDDRDRDWLRGSYDRRDSRDKERDRERDREFYRDDRYDRDRERDRDRHDDGYGRSRDRSRDRDYDRPRSPPDVRAPPPAPPPAARSAPAPPAPPAPTSQAAAAPSTKNMTAEERAAFIREQAAKRIQDRLRALGVEPVQDTPAVDRSVEERLEREKKEAEERSQNAEQEQAKREEARRARLAGAGTTKDDEPAPQPPKAPSAPSSPAAPLKSAMKKPAAPPPAPPSRGKAPPPAPVSRGATVAPPNAASAPKPPTVPPPTEDPEEAELRAREEARQRSIAERKARLAQMEKEEEEERKREEAILQARRDRSSVSSAVPAASPSVSSPPPAPPAPPAPSAPAQAESGGSYNPFRKPGAASTPAAAPSPGGFNPFFKPQAAATAQSPSPAATPSEPPAAPPAPPAPPAAPPAPPFASAQRSTPKPVEEDWDVIQEKEDSDSSDSDDDDYAHSRDKRGALASALFGGILGGGGSPTTSRPGSAAPQPPAAPPAPKAPAAALANLGGGDAKTGMGALLGAIQGGARLRKATTVDKSIAPGAGAVIDDAAPPAHINAAPSLPSPTRESVPSFPTPPPQEVPSAPPTAEYAPLEDEAPARNANRQSVDWYAGLAADAAHPPYESPLESTKEEEEPVSNGHAGGVPEVKVDDEDELDQFDMTKTLRVRTLYPYDGQREVDLSFKENLVIEAHPSKDPAGEWWYGSLVDTGSKGWFPHSYVEELHPVQAKALYAYEGSTPEELPFMADDILTIVDQSDQDWWKTVKAGAIFLVPASYLELMASPPASAAEAPRSISSPADPVAQISSAPAQVPISGPSTDLLSPTIPYDSTKNRSRASTLMSDDYDDDASSSSGDSILSFWTSDSDSDSETEIDVVDDVPAKPKSKAPTGDDRDKEAERKRREEERSRMMSAAGLQLRREPPGIPSRADRRVSRRRAPPAPGAKAKRTAPAVPDRSHKSSTRHTVGEEEGEGVDVDPVVETHDAYTRYEQYLASLATAPPPTPQPLAPVHSGTLPSGPRPNRPRANSRPLSTLSAQHTGASGSSPLSPSPTTSSLPQLGQGRLTGFLSRMMAPSTSTDRRSPAPAISGPVITRVDTPLSPDMAAGAGDTPTGDFGKTWSSLVDREVVDSMGDRERKRQEAIFEFIATEGAYNRDLQVVVEVFYASLLGLLDEKALTVIFANIEDLLLSNMGFFSALEQRQKACRLYVDVVGDVLVEWMPRMQGYMTYCVNQAQAARLLQSLRSTNPALQQHLQHVRETNASVRGLDLSSFLLIPMQRITRYPLLIKQILHYTAPDQDLPALQTALNAVEGIVARINEGVREAESYERLKVLSEDLWVGGEGRLDLTAPTAHLGPRRMLREGTVTKAKSGRKLTLVLCNDILVLIDSRNLYRMPIPLHELSVRPASRGEDSFVVKVEYHRGGDTIALRAANPKDAKEWVRIIGLASRHAVEARRENDRRVLAGMEYPM